MISQIFRYFLFNLILLFIFILNSCGNASRDLKIPEELTLHSFSNYKIKGKVQFPEKFNIKALPVESTVSLIDSSNGSTLATSKTDTDGVFTIDPPGNFNPPIGTVYILEAVKGLINNNEGYNAARLRSIIK